MASRFTYSQFEELIDTLERQQRISKKIYLAGEGFLTTGGEYGLVMDAKSGAFLIDLFDQIGEKAPSLQVRWDTLQRIRELSPIGARERWQTMDRIGSKLADEINALPAAEVRTWLKKEEVLATLPQEKQAPLLRKSMPDDVKPGISREKLTTEFTAVNREMKVQEKYPRAFKDLKNTVAAEFLIQPGETESAFKDITETVGQEARAASEQTRGLTGLVSLTRKKSITEQIDLIEYVMGRSDKLPTFIVEATQDAEEIGTMSEYVREMRTRLLTSEPIERAMIVNSFLAGPNGFMATEDGLNQMIDYLLKDVSPKNKGTANELASALIRAEGRNRSLAAAYVLGQLPGADGGKLAESRILKSLFEAYGVPGIKLGQYLAFTAELKGFREVLEELQDSAMPLNYIEGIRLCEERFGKDWPSKIQITGLKGSGSVNVALGYKDLQTGKNGVMSILRSNIENRTRLDFERFGRFIAELTKSPEGAAKYGYLAGLSGVINESVKLEFDKVHALKMQNFVIPKYKEDLMGWKIRTIRGLESKHGGNFTSLAPGRSARKILAETPEEYRMAMMALSQVEIDLLLGIGPDGNPNPVTLFANPDFHDGQVLIDVPKKMATILDFGQAVKLTNEERELGVNILRIISKADSAEKAASLLNDNPLLKKKGGQVAIADLEVILKKTQRMDIFIKLISLMERSNMPIPISSVHWVLAVNRQIALGEKIGVDNMRIFKYLVISNKFGLPQAFHNALYEMKRSVCSVFLGEAWRADKNWKPKK